MRRAQVLVTPDGLRSVRYTRFYAHALEGSVVVKTFYGPWAWRRAIAWVANQPTT